MDLMSGLTAISKALDVAKALREFDGQLNDATYKFQVAELYAALADAKISLADAKEEIALKEREIISLKEKQRSKYKTINHQGYNFGLNENGEAFVDPFCPVCEQQHDLQIPLQTQSRIEKQCPKCKAKYTNYPRTTPETVSH
ncbi:hypothetical protein [Pseudovibrio sp. JE062]|uniref:hypothetical protein n=1 Tax=Pseudovibrio sp. JE062 TaxID=439495 RepID=UPI000681B2CD|nr:hypothetical protein [Pseudovibrio sp. JE062]